MRWTIAEEWDIVSMEAAKRFDEKRGFAND